MSYVFYDVETTGLDKFFDQILHFAAIKTDDELNEIDRFDIKCRLLPHIVPSPKAILINGISAEQLTDSNLPSHYEMTLIIEEVLKKWSPAIFIGWNSISFDEDLLRQALYQNLCNPYVTNTNGNCRTDALNIARASSIFRPGILNIPGLDSGDPKYKLELVAANNGFSDHQSHTAISDVEATLYICKILFNKSPDFWSDCIRFSKKATVVSFIEEENVFCLSEFFNNRPHVKLVTGLGKSPSYSSYYYLFDLNNDPYIFNTMGDSDLIEIIKSSPKPIRIVKTNTSPILSYEDEAPEEFSDTLPSLQDATSRASYLRDNPSLINRLIKLAESTRKVYEDSPYVENQIYSDFTKNDDWELANQFHASDWGNRRNITSLMNDSRLRQLADRLIHIESPDSLPGNIRENIDIEMAKRLLGDHEVSVPWLTLDHAITKLDALLLDVSSEKESILLSLRELLSKNHQVATDILSSAQ